MPDFGSFGDAIRSMSGPTVQADTDYVKKGQEATEFARSLIDKDRDNIQRQNDQDQRNANLAYSRIMAANTDKNGNTDYARAFGQAAADPDAGKYDLSHLSDQNQKSQDNRNQLSKEYLDQANAGIMTLINTGNLSNDAIDTQQKIINTQHPNQASSTGNIVSIAKSLPYDQRESFLRSLLANSKNNSDYVSGSPGSITTPDSTTLITRDPITGKVTPTAQERNGTAPEIRSFQDENGRTRVVVVPSSPSSFSRISEQPQQSVHQNNNQGYTGRISNQNNNPNNNTDSNTFSPQALQNHINGNGQPPNNFIYGISSDKLESSKNYIEARKQYPSQNSSLSNNLSTIDQTASDVANTTQQNRQPLVYNLNKVLSNFTGVQNATDSAGGVEVLKKNLATLVNLTSQGLGTDQQRALSSARFPGSDATDQAIYVALANTKTAALMAYARNEYNESIKDPASFNEKQAEYGKAFTTDAIKTLNFLNAVSLSGADEGTIMLARKALPGQSWKAQKKFVIENVKKLNNSDYGKIIEQLYPNLLSYVK